MFEYVMPIFILPGGFCSGASGACYGQYFYMNYSHVTECPSKLCLLSVCDIQYA